MIINFGEFYRSIERLAEKKNEVQKEMKEVAKKKLFVFGNFLFYSFCLGISVLMISSFVKLSFILFV